MKEKKLLAETSPSSFEDLLYRNVASNRRPKAIRWWYSSGASSTYAIDC